MLEANNKGIEGMGIGKVCPFSADWMVWGAL